MSRNVKTATTSQGNNNKPDLMATLGIDKSQVIETTPKSTTSTPTTEVGKMKESAKQAIADVNKKHGKNISFTCFVRSGTDKETKKPLYKPSNKKGNWLVVERDDGLYEVTRTIYYSETHTIGDFNELDV